MIQEEDLIGALESGYLAGAGLDAVEVEPLHPTSPLWTMENVVISPHVGGNPDFESRIRSSLLAKTYRVSSEEKNHSTS